MAGASFLNGLAVVVWAAYSGVVTGTPTVTFPINSQVPPVARIGQPFSFVFSPSTFRSSSPMTYTLANSPGWLSMNGDKREISGVPTDDAVGPGSVVGVDIEVVATDESGSTTSKATLVVSRSQAPTLRTPLAAQSPSPKFHVFSSPSSLLMHYDTPFSFSLAADTFANPSGGRLSYYAVAADHTPLPAWLSFDASTLTISGRTPPLESLIQPPQTFDFQVLASDVVGFSGASLPFSLVVGVHEISPSSVTVKAVAGSTLSYTELQGTVKVDGQPTRPGDIKLSSTPNMPPWLSVDPVTLAISGNVPESATSTDFYMMLQDQYSDLLNLTVTVDLSTGNAGGTAMFTGPLPQPTLSTAGPFSIALSPYLTSSSDVDISLTTSPGVDWLRYDEAGMNLVGDVPSGIPPDYLVKTTIRATSKHSGQSQSQTMSLRIKLGTTSTGRDPLAQDRVSPSITRTALLASLIPSLFVFVAVALLLCLLRRRNRRDRGRRPSDLSSQDISGPLPGSLIKNGSGGTDHAYYDTMKRQSVSSTFEADRRSLFDRMFKRPRLVYLPTQSRTRKPSSRDRMRTMSDNALDGVRYLRTSVVGAAVGVLQQPIKPAKKSKSRCYLSDSSIYEVYGGRQDNSSLALLGNDSRTSFRDAIEIGIPGIDALTPWGPRTPVAAHITRCPEEQGQPEVSPKPTPPLKHSPLKRSSHTGVTVSQERASTSFFAPRAASRLSKISAASSKAKIGQPRTEPSTLDFLHTVKEQASTLSLLTVDTFAAKKKANHVETDDGEDGVSEVICLPPPIPARHAARDSAALSSRQSMMHASHWVASQNRGGARTVSGTSEYSRTDHAPDVSEAEVLQPFPSNLSQPRDNLGIAYADLIKDSPLHPSLHPSKSWSTLYSNEAAGSAKARERVGAQSLHSMENWTVLQDAFDTDGGSTGATKDQRDFLSPSKWPKDGNFQGLGARSNWPRPASPSKRAWALHGGPPKSSGSVSVGSGKENISTTGSILRPSLKRGKSFATPTRQEGSLSSRGSGIAYI